MTLSEAWCHLPTWSAAAHSGDPRSRRVASATREMVCAISSHQYASVGITVVSVAPKELPCGAREATLDCYCSPSPLRSRLEEPRRTMADPPIGFGTLEEALGDLVRHWKLATDARRMQQRSPPFQKQRWPRRAAIAESTIYNDLRHSHSRLNDLATDGVHCRRPTRPRTTPTLGGSNARRQRHTLATLLCRGPFPHSDHTLDCSSAALRKVLIRPARYRVDAGRSRAIDRSCSSDREHATTPLRPPPAL